MGSTVELQASEAIAHYLESVLGVSRVSFPDQEAEPSEDLRPSLTIGFYDLRDDRAHASMRDFSEKISSALEQEWLKVRVDPSQLVSVGWNEESKTAPSRLGFLFGGTEGELRDYQGQSPGVTWRLVPSLRELNQSPDLKRKIWHEMQRALSDLAM